MNLTHSKHETYCLSSVSYTYELQFNNLTVESSHDGDLVVYSTEMETNEDRFYYDEDDTEYWLGCVLFWWDADQSCEWNVEQVDAIARLAKHRGVVPDENEIKKFCVPTEDTCTSYDEMILLLEKELHEST